MYRPTPHFLMALGILGLLAIVGLASAATVNVTWTNPTTRTDGSALTAAELRGTRVERGTCSGVNFGTVQGEVIVAAGATGTSFDLSPGAYCFRAFARAVDRANTANSLESIASNVAARAIADSPPSPPTGLTTTMPTVYDMAGRKLGREVGLVALGVPCSSAMAIVKGDKVYYQIEPAAVDLFRKPRGLILLAECRMSDA